MKNSKDTSWDYLLVLYQCASAYSTECLQHVRCALACQHGHIFRVSSPTPKTRLPKPFALEHRYIRGPDMSCLSPNFLLTMCAPQAILLVQGNQS